MSASATIAAEAMVDRLNLTTQVYERLLARITNGRWSPGERLNIEQLARELRVSVTPVREALARLSSQHLVQFESYKGYRVLPAMDATHVAQLFDARLLIEVGTVRAGILRVGAEQLRHLHEDVEMLRTVTPEGPVEDFHAAMAADQAFHSTLVAAAGNDLLVDMYEMLVPLMHLGRLRYTRQSFFAEQQHVVAEHAAILAAYERRDADAAEECVRRHLLQARERVEQGLLSMVPEVAEEGARR